MNDHATVKAGDTVRVKDPDAFLSELARKVRDRDAVVEWVGSLADGHFKGRAKVKFLKRNGRGKEFSKVMCLDDLVKKDAQ